MPEEARTPAASVGPRPGVLASRFYVNGRRVDAVAEARPTARDVLRAAGESVADVDVFRLQDRHDETGKKVDLDATLEPQVAPVYLRCVPRTDEGRALGLRDLSTKPETGSGRRTEAAFGPRPGRGPG